MKRILSKVGIFMSFVLISIFPFMACPPTSSAAGTGKPIAWTFTHCCSPNTGWGKAVQVWVDRIKKESDGRIVITVYPNGQLSGGNQQKEIELVQSGDIQAGVLPIGVLVPQEPRYQITQLPFAVSDSATGDKVLSGPEGKKLLSYLEPKGMKGIAVGSAGFRHFIGREKVLLKPEDFKNIKIRVMPGELSTLIFRQLGADPVNMNYGDLYTALQQKALDAIEMPASFTLNDKFYEVAKHFTVSNYHYQAVTLCANLKAWNSLSPEDQSLIQRIGDEVFSQQRRDVEMDDLSALEQMKRFGVSIYRLSPEQLKAFREKMQPVYEVYTKRYGSAVTEFLNACKSVQ